MIKLTGVTVRKILKLDKTKEHLENNKDAHR